MKPESAAAQRLQRPIRLTQILSAAFQTPDLPPQRLFRRIRHSVRSCLPQKQLCRPYLYQTDTKGTGIQRKNQAECSGIRRKGKRIVLVDDSIVRGTTISNLITMLRKAGATEVHVRISSPPFLYPCYFGTDVPSNKQLIASSHSTEEIRQQIGADS